MLSSVRYIIQENMFQLFYHYMNSESVIISHFIDSYLPIGEEECFASYDECAFVLPSYLP